MKKTFVILLFQTFFFSTVAMAQSHCDSLRNAFFEDMRQHTSGRSYYRGDVLTMQILTLYNDSVFEWRDPWYFEKGRWSLKGDSILSFSANRKKNRFVKSEKDGAPSLQLYNDQGEPLPANVTAHLDNGECVKVESLNDRLLNNMFILPENTESVSITPSTVTKYFEVMRMHIEPSSNQGKGTNYIVFIEPGKKFDGEIWLKRDNEIYPTDSVGNLYNTPLIEQTTLAFYSDTLPGENIYQKRRLILENDGTYTYLRLGRTSVHYPPGMIARDSRWRAKVFGKESYWACGRGKWYITEDHRLKVVPTKDSDNVKERIFVIDGKDLIDIDTKRIYTLQDK